jgi:hypothetical protein
LNSLLNLRLCIFHLPLHETPKLGVHETGGRPITADQQKGFSVKGDVHIYGAKLESG